MGQDRLRPSSYQRGPELLVWTGWEIPKPVDSPSGPQVPELPALDIVPDQVLGEPRLMQAPLLDGPLGGREPVRAWGSCADR